MRNTSEGPLRQWDFGVVLPTESLTNREVEIALENLSSSQIVEVPHAQLESRQVAADSNKNHKPKVKSMKSGSQREYSVRLELVSRRAIRGLVCMTLVAACAAAAEWEPWQERALADLCAKYAAGSLPPNLSETMRAEWIDRLFRQIGARLASGGAAAIPAQDMALLALLQSRLAAGQSATPLSGPVTGQPAGSVPPERAKVNQIADTTRGEEGFQRAQETIAQHPITERMIINGDITTGVQGATVPGSPDLASTFGRARVNFVMRAMSAGGSGHAGLGDGYFFVQMAAAGGASDSSVVGGPVPFTAFDNIAADRSAFNEPTARGNLYVSKVFYEQRLDLGNNYLTGRAGIIDLSDYFDTSAFANNESRQFMNQAFVNSAAYKTGISAPGLMVAYHREVHRDWLDSVVLRGAYAISRTERAFTSPVWTGEVELQTRLNGYEGHWRFGGTVGNRAGAGSLRGFRMSVDHWLSSNVGVFGRYAITNSSAGSLFFGQARQSYSGGVQVQFVNARERVSAWSAGFSQAFGIPGSARLASERVLETYYRWQWTRNIGLTPDFQLVLGSGGRQARGTQAVFGARLFFAF